MSNEVLNAANVSKHYRLYDTPQQRFRALVTGKSLHRSHWALRNLTLSLYRGQCLGVIGDNGAGKSTFLKLMAGTLQPSEGSLKLNGRVTAILELGAGFHPDFTGRENLRFAGSLIGISEAEMQALESSIIAFSELGDAIDRPVKTYSSGMTVRLAFALVTAVEPDVLIVDEALAVGDQHFQKKCIERIERFKHNGCTILFCSHSLYHVRHLCDTTLWLNKGETQAIGPTEDVLAQYEQHVRQQEAAQNYTKGALRHGAATSDALPLDATEGDVAQATGPAALVSVNVDHLDDQTPPLLTHKDLAITVTARGQGTECPSIGVMLEQANGVGITSVAMHAEKAKPQRLPNGLWRTTLVFTDLPLHSGEYLVSAYLFDASGMVVYEEWKDCARFKFLYPSLTPGLVRLPHHWS